MNSNLISQVKEIQWVFDVCRKFNWFVENIQILANSRNEQQKYLGFANPYKNYLILNGEEYYSQNEFENWYSFWDSKFNDDNDFFNKFSQKLFDITSRTIKYTEELKRTKLDNLNNNELISIFEDFVNHYIESFIPAWTRPDNYLEIQLKADLRNKYHFEDSEIEAIFSEIATYPELGELSYVDEPLHLLEIATEIKDKKINLSKLPEDINDRIQNHIKKYSWLKGSLFYNFLTFTKKDYLDRLRLMIQKDSEKEISRINSIRKQKQKDYEAIIRRHHFNSETLSLIEAVRSFIFLRTHTTEVSDYLFFIGRSILFKEISNRLDLNLNDITMLSSIEIVKNLKCRDDSVNEIIEKREKGFIIIWINGKVETLFGDESLLLIRKIKRILTKDTDKLYNKIIGRSASRGKVRGIAKVLNTYKDVFKLNKGEILIASMTTPDYIMAMEKASAFVTDEGGITCHAAILAREFGVPCIVGTKVATQIIKDGDNIEVDADNAVVLILRKDKH